MRGYVCYRSGWDLSSSFSTPGQRSPPVSCSDDAEQLCIKPGFNDICTNITTTFISGACPSSFSLSSRVPADFLDPSEINLTAPVELPAVIKAGLPPNCNNLTVDYTCWRGDGYQNKSGAAADGLKLRELEPFTSYSCSAQIKDHDDIIVNHTAAVSFSVDCGAFKCSHNTAAPHVQVPDVQVPDVQVPDVQVPDVKCYRCSGYRCSGYRCSVFQMFSVPDVQVIDVQVPDVQCSRCSGYRCSGSRCSGSRYSVFQMFSVPDVQVIDVEVPDVQCSRCSGYRCSANRCSCSGCLVL
ncbi:Periaxin [Liparis tanakae]|uniref:Periaxin n=1 Tax=Liparis tanakae TaxID=230148 RepID=A0A4Z2ECR3_9TELE|nr:Periaxin [Liparis tanakae]